MTPIRFKVLKHFLFHKQNNVKPVELIRFFFDRSYKSKYNSTINKIELEGSFQKIYFKNINKPLYYPSDFPESSLQQVIGESFFHDNWHYYEIPQTRVEEKDVVVDCGAAEGLFGFLVASRCKQLFLIEPISKFCDSLEKTFSEQENVVILKVALSNQEGEARINENNISSSLLSGTEGSLVKVTTLDKLFYEKEIPISYIKIDLEGYDFDALLGAKELIKKNKPKIAVTTYHHYEHAEQIESFLKSIHPTYNILKKGIYQETGSPVMLHAWI